MQHKHKQSSLERRQKLERLLKDHPGADEALRSQVLQLFDEHSVASGGSLVPDHLLEDAADAIIVHNLDGHILAINAIACFKLGYSKAELMGKHIRDLAYDYQPERFVQRRDRIMARKSYTFEVTQVHRDGHLVPLEVNARLVHYHGQPAILSIGRDLTARKAAESIMMEQKQFLTAVLEHLPVGLVVKRVSSDYSIHLWNAMMERLTGLSRDEALGRTDFDILPAPLAESFRANEEQAVGKGIIVDRGEFEAITQTGTFMARTITVPLLNADGDPESVLVMVMDVTERVKAQERLLLAQEELEHRVEERTAELQRAHDRLMEAEEHYRALYEQSSEAIFVIDESGSILHGNPAARAIFGYPADEIRALDPLDLIHPEDRIVAPGVLKSVRGGKIVHTELRMRRKDGGYVDVVLAAKRIAGNHVLATLWDITNRKTMERELRAAKVSAERANEAKSEFLANMSHEIRTPMGGILGMTDMVLSMDLRKEQREYLKGIKAASLSLLDIINDILDFSKIEANKLDLALEPFNVAAKVESLCDTFRLDAERKGIELSSRIDPAIPKSLRGDAGRIGQVLANLLSNSIKFTDCGRVDLDVSLMDQSGAKAFLRFTVSDTGIGIAPNQKNKLFDVFSQLDTSFSKRQPGTGLGLAISRRLVEMMGGVIHVESEPGVGSSFSFSLKLEMPEAHMPHPSKPAETSAAERTCPEPPVRSRRILLAEDNILNQEFLTHFLVEAGHEVTVAENGLQALEHLERGEFDIVLMDIQMPEMDGIKATQAIRSHGGSKYDPNIPILALTAYAMTGDKERMISAGMNDYLSKPVDMDKLLGLVALLTAASEPL